VSEHKEGNCARGVGGPLECDAGPVWKKKYVSQGGIIPDKVVGREEAKDSQFPVKSAV
jgi:hypothetical protein